MCCCTHTKLKLTALVVLQTSGMQIVTVMSNRETNYYIGQNNKTAVVCQLTILILVKGLD